MNKFKKTLLAVLLTGLCVSGEALAAYTYNPNDFTIEYGSKITYRANVPGSMKDVFSTWLNKLSGYPVSATDPAKLKDTSLSDNERQAIGNKFNTWINQSGVSIAAGDYDTPAVKTALMTKLDPNYKAPTPPTQQPTTGGNGGTIQNSAAPSSAPGTATTATPEQAAVDDAQNSALNNHKTAIDINSQSIGILNSNINTNATSIQSINNGVNANGNFIAGIHRDMSNDETAFKANQLDVAQTIHNVESRATEVAEGQKALTESILNHWQAEDEATQKADDAAKQAVIDNHRQDVQIHDLQKANRQQDADIATKAVKADVDASQAIQNKDITDLKSNPKTVAPVVDQKTIDSAVATAITNQPHLLQPLVNAAVSNTAVSDAGAPSMAPAVTNSAAPSMAPAVTNGAAPAAAPQPTVATQAQIDAGQDKAINDVTNVATTAQNTANTAQQQAKNNQLKNDSQDTLIDTNKASIATANTNLSNLQQAVNQVNTFAHTANDTATKAQTDATDAKNLATTASTDAKQAKTDAATALTTANGIDAKATKAGTDAAQAESDAQAAKLTADQANTTAGQNKTDIASNKSSINANKADVATNKKGITDNTQTISKLATTQQNFTSRIDQNQADILSESHARAEGDKATLKAANAYTDSKFANIDKRLSGVKKQANAGSASAPAAVGIPGLNNGQTWNVGAGVGQFGNAQAVAVGANYRVSESVAFKVGRTASPTTQDFGVFAGVSIGN